MNMSERFCTYCGQNNSLFPNEKTDASTKTRSAKIWAIEAIVAIVVVLAVVWVRQNSYKRVLDKYFEAYETQDVDLMYSIYAEYWKDFYDEGFYDGYAYDRIKEKIDSAKSKWEQHGDDIKIKYKVEETRRATEEELEELEEEIYDDYAYYVRDKEEFEITDAYVLEISFTVTGDEGSGEYHVNDGLLLIKEDGKWRVTDGWISCSFYGD